ncbi:DUF3325 family protein [Duganella sp. FT94W]|uniref:DUF3325 family protein n=1 Tax=Duganella lactea TaxID=2692173 RepID=A0ABW9V7E9_9BURK|nr:DUF3325 family protein [Duganella lactea]
MLLLACAASYGGFACIALAMPDYWERAGGDTARHAPRRRRLRYGGAALLALSLAACLWRDGPGFGALLWGVLLTAGAIAVAFTLTWRPRLLGLFTGTPPR